MTLTVHRRDALRWATLTLSGLASGLTLAPRAQAQSGDTRKLALLSMVGQEIELVEHVLQVGSRVPPKRQQLALGSGLLDQRATLAMDKLARNHLPAKDVVLMSAQGKMWQELQRDAIDSEAGMKDMVATVADAAQRGGCTHALALIKLRGVAKLQLADSTIGEGMLEGLGFYIDTEREVLTVGTQESHRGVLAPFAYMKLLYVDARAVRLLGSETVQLSTSMGLPTGTLGHPWDALSADAKAQVLTKLIEQGVGSMVPALLAPTKTG